MFKHIVFWRLKDSDNGHDQLAAARVMKEKFEALCGVIPGLHRIELGIDISRADDSCDVALYSEFESRAAFDVYYAHPAHQELVQFIKSVRTERRMVDWED